MTNPEFTMKFEPSTIEHLGLKLYSSLPPVIGELVSNAWDADANAVEVNLPEGQITEDSIVIVKDFGCGMSRDELQNAYLRIGRNRRENGVTQTPGGRYVMGRKGLGKLSAFGVASILEIRTVKNGEAICLRLDYGSMKTWPADRPYEPEVLVEESGPTNDPSGTEIRLKKLTRKTPIIAERIRKDLARRFTIISQNGAPFDVSVNGTSITPGDRRLDSGCDLILRIDPSKEGIVDPAKGWVVSGWIGFVERSSQVDRGVDVFARGKVVELQTMFNFSSTRAQWARAYLVGELHADFLDDDEDCISTARNSVRWESDAGQALEHWGQSALRVAFESWLAERRKKREDSITSTADFKRWYGGRTPHEQRVATKMIRAIVEDDDVEPETADRLLNIVKVNIEYQAFQELVDEIEEGKDAKLVLQLFSDWRIIEAREHLKLADGRAEVIEKLYQYIREGALEVKEIQPLFEEHGWLVNPAWSDVTGQTTYTQLLREHCKEPKDTQEINRRIDILGYEDGGTVQVVELKRPQTTLNWDHLDQIERYVSWAKAHILGTGGANGPGVSRILGTLVVGDYGNNHEVRQKMERLRPEIEVITFRDIHRRSMSIFGQVEARLQKIAPEYAKPARRARKAEKKAEAKEKKTK